MNQLIKKFWPNKKYNLQIQMYALLSGHLGSLFLNLLNELKQNA